MNVGIVDYSQISSSYRLVQPAWLKAIVMLVAIGTLILSGYLVVSLQPNMILLVGLAIVIIVFGVAFNKQRSSGMWHALLANKQALFIIASANGHEFLQIPWRYLHDIRPGMHGLNKRGLIISFNSSLLSDTERDLIRQYLNVTEEQTSQITISVPTGIVNRNDAIQKLKAYQ